MITHQKQMKKDRMVGELAVVYLFICSLHSGLQNSPHDLLYWLIVMVKQRRGISPALPSQHLYIYFSLHYVHT